jgi:hypothetical protein
VAGAVCGHTLAYTVSYPDRAARQSVLEVTGHAYWHAAIAAALIGAAWFAIHHVVRHFRAPRRDHALLWPALPALQIAVFVGMEVSERLVAGVPLATILNHAAVGLASQLLVATLLAVAMYFLGRVAAAVGRLVSLPPRLRPARFFGPAARTVPALRLAVVPCGSRGPPYS